MTTGKNPAPLAMITVPIQRLVFWISVAVVTALYCLLLPGLLLPRKAVLAVIKSFLAIVLWLLRHVLGLKWEIHGSDAIGSGPTIIASKHQSAFETIILQYIIPDPVFLLKQELLSIPIAGAVMRKLGHIGVDRTGELEGVRKLLSAARRATEAGRPIIIFPEGSRREVGAPPDYKAGVDLLYTILKATCIPVAVNSGCVWPARAFTPGRGMIAIQFLAPIAPGLPRATFALRLQTEIETATAKLQQRAMT